jgi:hypothetical protein
MHPVGTVAVQKTKAGATFNTSLAIEQKAVHCSNPATLLPVTQTKSMKHIYTAVLITFMGLRAGAQNTTVTVTAAKDNTIFQEVENSNGVGANFFAGSTAAGNNGALRRGLLYFNLTAIPPGSTVVSATLNLYCNKGRPVVAPVFLHRANAAWGEGSSDAGSDFDGAGVAATAGDATWLQRVFGSNAWAATGGDFVATASASTSIGAFDQFYSWASAQLTADVQAWINAPASNNGWVLLGDEAVQGSAKRFAAREAADPGQRPQLTVTYTGPIPVTLAHFTARPTGGNVQLNWQTAQELNNDFFAIEHSTDGQVFAAIGRVNGAGTVSTPRSYAFSHNGVGPGRHYYRLAQTDRDGRVQYSPVVQVVVRKSGAMAISPNPAIDFVKLGDTPYPDNTVYTVVNAAGAIVQQGRLQQGGFNVAALPSGLYVVKLLQPGGVPEYGRLVKR